jgi:hypothetical protein
LSAPLGFLPEGGVKPARPEPPAEPAAAPELAERMTPDSGHKFCGVVLIVTAAVILAHVFIMATMSDETLRGILSRTTLIALMSEAEQAKALREVREGMKSAPILAG